MQEAKQSGGEASLPTGWTACQSGAVNLQEFLQALTRESRRRSLLTPPSSPETDEAPPFPPFLVENSAGQTFNPPHLPRRFFSAATKPARGKAKRLLGGRGTGLERGEARRATAAALPPPPFPFAPRKRANSALKLVGLERASIASEERRLQCRSGARTRERGRRGGTGEQVASAARG